MTQPGVLLSDRKFQCEREVEADSDAIEVPELLTNTIMTGLIRF